MLIRINWKNPHMTSIKATPSFSIDNKNIVKKFIKTYKPIKTAKSGKN